MSRLQIAVVAITVGLNALDGFDVLAISFASPGIARAWGIDRAALGIVLSMELIGMGIGSILLGGVADRIGRRRTLLGCLTVMALGMIMAARAQGVYDLSVWRVFTGLGIGGMLASINAVADGILERPAPQPQRVIDGHRLSHRRRRRRQDRRAAAETERLARGIRVRRGGDGAVPAAGVLVRARVRELAVPAPTGRRLGRGQSRFAAHGLLRGGRIAGDLCGGPQALRNGHFQPAAGASDGAVDPRLLFCTS